MAIIQQKERELRYARQSNLQQEAAVSANYMRDMIRAYGLDLNYYKLKVPYPEVFKPILDMNNLTMQAYGYDRTPEYEVVTPIIAYWQFSDDTLVLNQYGVQPNRVAKCWIDATDFAIAMAKKLSEYKEYKIKSDTTIELEFDDFDDFANSIKNLYLKFESDLFNGECKPVFTNAQLKYLESLLGNQEIMESDSIDLIESESMSDRETDSSEINDDSTEEDSVEDDSIDSDDSMDDSSSLPDEPIEPQHMTVPCQVVSKGELLIKTPHVVPDFWKGKKYEDFIDDIFDSYISLNLISLIPNSNRRGNSFKIIAKFSGAIIYYDLNVISKYHQFIKPDVGDVVSIPMYNHGDTISRFEIVHIQGTKYNETYQNPFLRNYIYECDLRTYVSSGEKVPEERDEENKFRKLNELINFANSEAGRKISLYKDHEDNVYGGYDKVSGLDGAILAANEEQGKTINDFTKREDKGTPPSEIDVPSIISGDVEYLRIADLNYPAQISLAIATNVVDDWSKLVIMHTESMQEPLNINIPWQHYLRCNDNTLTMRMDGRIYCLATMLYNAKMYEDTPIVIPRRLKRNVYAQRGGYNDQPFNLVDSGENELDLGLYSEELMGSTAGDEYKGKELKNAGLSRLCWRNTRSYMDITIMEKPDKTQYYELAVIFKGERRKRRFPLAILPID